MKWKRRAGLYVSTNGTHSDLSVVVMETYLGESASLSVMFFVRVINYVYYHCPSSSVCVTLPILYKVN